MTRAFLIAVVLAACSDPGSMPEDAADPDASEIDGPPTRVPCTNQLGTAMSAEFGRLDGVLVSIVPAGNGGCNADSSHIHLQIKANNAIYDIAVNVGVGAMQDVHSTTREMRMPGPAWAEGWHPAIGNDYVALGVHAADIPLQTGSQLTADVTADLSTANHISVFAIGYGPDGGHLVHRNGSGRDGLLITKPLASTAHVRLFSFSTQTF
ncbi:hypothetical protein BH11MYX3_BH11MYX3_16460 [soil metagenome]